MTTESATRKERVASYVVHCPVTREVLWPVHAIEWRVEIEKVEGGWYRFVARPVNSHNSVLDAIVGKPYSDKHDALYSWFTLAMKEMITAFSIK